MNRLQLMKVHALLAAFIFPVALMFMITGSLYTWGIKGNYFVESYEIQVNNPLHPDLNSLIALAETELAKRGLSRPSGKAKIKTIGSAFMFEWAGAEKDITLAPSRELVESKPMATLTVKDATWYRNLVQLHKAKGGIVFKVYAVVFAISMTLLLLSGFIMAWQTPKLKKITLITFFTGIGSFLVIAWLS